MNTGITVPKACRIDGVVAAENTRYAINGVRLDAERKSLMATDGRVAVELPIADMNGETTASLPREAFKALRKGRQNSPRTLSCDGKHAVITGNGCEERFPVDTELSFPDVPSVLDSAVQNNDYVVLGINAAYLADLAAAMGVDHVIVRVPMPDPGKKCVHKALYVSPLPESAPIANARGVIMPVNVR